MSIPAKDGGRGSAVNGGEMLCLALATCFCNDLYREARNLGIEVSSVEVVAAAEFGEAGEPARSIRYSAKVTSDAPAERIRELIERTDRLAEVQTTLRRGIPVELVASD